MLALLSKSARIALGAADILHPSFEVVNLKAKFRMTDKSLKSKSTHIDLISPSVQANIDSWLAKYPPDKKRSALLIALRLVQEDNGGWLSTALMDAVADY
jgi:hypothetical protein